MNLGLIVKFFCAAMLGKRNLCECYTRFLNFFFHEIRPFFRISFILWFRFKCVIRGMSFTTLIIVFVLLFHCFSQMKLLIKIFFETQCIYYFLLYKKKYWFRANFRLLVFDGFTRLGMQWTQFDYFWKMYVCLCVSVCVTKILWQV